MQDLNYQNQMGIPDSHEHGLARWMGSSTELRECGTGSPGMCRAGCRQARRRGWRVLRQAVLLDLIEK